MQNVRFPTTQYLDDPNREQLNFQIEALLPDFYDLFNTTYFNMMDEIPVHFDDCRVFHFYADDAQRFCDIEFWCFEDRVDVWSCLQLVETLSWEDLANDMIPEISDLPAVFGEDLVDRVVAEISETSETRTLASTDYEGAMYQQLMTEIRAGHLQELVELACLENPLAEILSMIPRNCMTLEDEEDLLFAPSEINTDHLMRAVGFLVAAYDQT